MNVYVVMSEDYDTCYPEGVFSTGEKAKDLAILLRNKSKKASSSSYSGTDYSSHFEVYEYPLDIDCSNWKDQKQKTVFRTRHHLS